MRYHNPGTSTDSGYSMITRVDSGNGVYGTHVTFQRRFTDMKGSPIVPNVIVVPKQLVTYHPSGSANTQYLDFGLTATAGGFTASAALKNLASLVYASADGVGNFRWWAFNGKFV